MPIFRSKAVADEPTICLARWSIRKTDAGDLHLVGFSIATRDGRVSTTVMRFDSMARTALTASGRCYRLVGPGGYDPDAEYVWNWATKAWQIAAWSDVTEELVPDWRHGLPMH